MNQAAFRKPLWWMVAILLLATAFRFLAADSAPPGWRDDELIEYNMDRRIADGWRPLFITEAEGHEPVYHYLHAGTLLLFGDNLVGYKWLPLAAGLLTIALTYALARKMFRRRTQPDGAVRTDSAVRIAVLAAALLAVSFWPVMYSRFGLRHIGVLPWMLAAFYLLYPSPWPFSQSGERVRSAGCILLAGICLAAALMTYFAGRAVPIILIGFLVYLALFNRSVLRRIWWRYLLAIGIAALIALPMFVEIANTPGSEKRTEVVGGPLLELRQGKLQPAINTTLGTLGMFTFAGDPESLYNVPGRPVFDWITGLFFYLGIVVCLIRLRRIESGFALVWLSVGIAPAFVSIPAASFSHTIAALPIVYMLAAVGVIEAGAFIEKLIERRGDSGIAEKWSGISPSLYLSISLSLLLIMLGGWLTIHDYFGTWANDPFVRFQYHAPTREVAQWLNDQPQAAVAIGTDPNELILDPLAMKLDMKHAIPVSWFNAESALASTPEGVTILTAMRAPGAEVQQILSDTVRRQDQQPEFTVYAIAPRPGGIPPLGGTFDQDRLHLLSIESAPADQVHAGSSVTWRTAWSLQQPTTQPSLKMFLHVLNDKGEVIAGDDREDLNFSTLGAGSLFWQVSQLTLPNDLSPGRYAIELGWYNPDTGERLKRNDGSDRFLLAPLNVIAP